MTTEGSQPPRAPRQHRREEPRQRRYRVRCGSSAQGGHVGPVRVGQLVVVQIVLLALVAAYPQPGVVSVPVTLVGLAVVGGIFARRGGRWWYQDLLGRLRLHRRRQARRRAGGQLLTPLAPALRVGETTERGMRIGIGVDSDGWFAALGVTAGDPDEVLRVLLELDPPVSALQMVRHAVPVATVMSPAGEQTWVALRLAASDAPEQASSRGGGVEGVHRALAAAVARVGKALRTAGIDRRPLTADELVETLWVVSGWHGADATAVRMSPERWGAWLGADAEHICFQLTGTFAPEDLVTALHTVSALSTTMSLLVLPGEPRQVRGLLRVAVAEGMAGMTVAEVIAAAGRAGCSLRRLDGAHGPAIYAVAPTACGTGGWFEVGRRFHPVRVATQP